MNFEHTGKVKGLIAQVAEFMRANVYPNEDVYERQIRASASLMHSFSPLIAR